MTFSAVNRDVFIGVLLHGRLYIPPGPGSRLSYGQIDQERWFLLHHGLRLSPESQALQAFCTRQFRTSNGPDLSSRDAALSAPYGYNVTVHSRGDGPLELAMLAVILAGLAVVAVVGVYIRGLEPRDVWSIGIYEGTDPLSIHAAKSAFRQPVLSATEVTDVPARFVADPFLVRDGNRWWMFLEVLNKRSRRGEIAVASSTDGVAWTYDRIVLRELFHLSYPYVFEADGGYWMIPECGQAGAVRLYRAAAFPYEWRFDRELLSGRYVDSSVLRFDSRWWLFAQRDGRALVLHFADRLDGPWSEHPASPIVRCDPAVSRPGGRILVSDGRILRFSQDGEGTYGRRLRAFQIEELTTIRYREREVSESPVLDATGSGWNADGMHHVDALQVGPGRWIAAVDGKRIVQRFNWRRGVRQLGAR